MSKTTQITLQDLFTTIRNKIDRQEKDSYSYSLIQKGIERITRKVGEEAIEVVVAAFAHDREKSEEHKKELIGEVCDLFYHSLVLLASQNIEFSEILEELNQRNSNKK